MDHYQVLSIQLIFRRKVLSDLIIINNLTHPKSQIKFSCITIKKGQLIYFFFINLFLKLKISDNVNYFVINLVLPKNSCTKLKLFNSEVYKYLYIFLYTKTYLHI